LSHSAVVRVPGFPAPPRLGFAAIDWPNQSLSSANRPNPGVQKVDVGANMKSDTPKPVLLADYRPPDFLIDTVDLDIVLDPTRTRVTSKLTLRRNPKTKVSAKAPLKLTANYSNSKAFCSTAKR